MSIMGFYSHF